MHIFLTGASSGIGAALAHSLARRIPGAHITLVARTRTRLEQVATDIESLGARPFVLPCDLSDPDAAQEALQHAIELHGPVDVLINNAGSQVVGPTAQVDIRWAEQSLALDLTTPLRLVHTALPTMSRGARIWNVASAAALAPTPGMTWYNAAKAGLAAASEALRGELKPAGIDVTTIYPGIIQTRMADEALAAYGPSRALSLQPVLRADDLAEDIVTAGLSGRARLIAPRSYGLARWFPAITRWIMDRFAPTPAIGGTGALNAATAEGA